MSFIGNLKGSLAKGFIDKEIHAVERFKPRLVTNDVEKRETVLSTIIEELDQCGSFFFSVAFITESGLATLKSHLYDLHLKGIKGRILTSTFLNFNQPKAFRELQKLNNVEVRLANVEGFHSKGYIFSHKHYTSLIVGSSNLTAHALKVNHEWNVKLTSHDNGDIIHHFKQQFEEVWNKAQPLNEEWINQYESNYQPEVSNSTLKVSELPSHYGKNSLQEALEIEPNSMQKAALKEIEAVREEGHQRALVISATGTGKTYLSAFDVRRFRPRRILFIVHREQILRKAQEDYKRILGGTDDDFGILGGSHREHDKKYLFATIQTISKQEKLQQFDPEEFDYILIDEVHKAGAPSYLRVIDYFQPKFLLGMTATPERTDDFNIFELFNYNIAYEIRLQEALEEDMLCPFHYFGVSDVYIEDEVYDSGEILSKLTAADRVDHLVEKIEYYGHSGDAIRGLMFCSRKDEARELSTLLNSRGYRTVALTGDDDQEVRLQQVQRLENGEIEYILTVDIFNEGIDIPSVNQVVMLRQTQSSIIFVQQLGRGLRKHDSKEFVTVIDFIGNYKNNYLIPVALSGDNSQNKDNIRRHMTDTSYVTGTSTVNFEAVAKERIYKSINSSNLTTLKIMREAYIHLKNRVGRIPRLFDFVINHSIDPVTLVKKYSTYYQFLLRLKEVEPFLSKYEEQVLAMLSNEILDGKRQHELILLDQLIKCGSISESSYKAILEHSELETDEETMTSLKRIFDLTYFTVTARKKYGEIPVVELDEKDQFRFNSRISERLSSNSRFLELIEDVLLTGLELSKRYNTKQPFTLYEKYTRKDTCRLLNWQNDESAAIFGYKVKHGDCPIFITYHKHDDVEASINYGDELVSADVLKWYTRSNRTVQSNEVKQIIEAQERDIDIHIFVKKDDDEGTDFYYLGKALPDQSSVEQTSMLDKNGRTLPVVTMNLLLENEVEHPLFMYLTGAEDNYAAGQVQ
ncbi:DUF3427 domain-containing protein [Bhargavaea massiliensis]|uniref:DUF3427 domain-containing protein n=1 Tax=Bhargavaea massiliensis TaxID=2697500 RepID=UPI001BCB5FD0|nr:DEAD/DEAH box helicase [Bhargavaea massiliensis]